MGRPPCLIWDAGNAPRHRVGRATHARGKRVVDLFPYSRIALIIVRFFICFICWNFVCWNFICWNFICWNIKVRIR